MDDSTFDAKRRNLLAISVVLCFLKYADASFLTTATVSSLSLSIRKPEAITHLLWLLWGYFFLRAYQHYSYHLSVEYKRSIQKTLVPILHKHVAQLGIPEEHERFFFEELERFHKYELRFSWRRLPRAVFELVRLPLAWLAQLVRKLATPARFGSINLIRFPSASTGLRPHVRSAFRPWVIRVWSISLRPSDAPARMEIGISAEQPIPFLFGLLLHLRIAFKLTLFSAPFFDYRLPFLLALVPVGYWLLV